MLPLKKHTILMVFAILAFVLLVSQCGQKASKNEVQTTYLNLGDTAQYVGIQACAQCHADIYNSFVNTGMGQSFAAATRQKSAGHFAENGVLYDSVLDFRYNIGWQGDSLLIRESRPSEDKRKKNGLLKYELELPHARQQCIDFIVGSGQHTNSHIYSENGYLFQAPFTVYTQSGKLGLPPGFEGGKNSRFDRVIGLECMSCHNAMPTGFVAGSENKFERIPQGIDCERCHGPGSLHVAKIQQGKITDTAIAIDYSIVNPEKLSSDLQFEICQRCHLQGNAVLAKGKSFFDFKPGMHLDSVMDVYLPRYQNSDNQFIMASHVDRFKLSKCFVAGEGKFTCTSCHNPHVSVRETNIARYNKTCESCHGGLEKNYGCMKVVKHLDGDQFNCVKCHMPSSGSSDIPHVTVHDHHIQVPKNEKLEEKDRGAFLGLAAINTKKPSKRSRIRAYLQQFERFEQNPIFLDSAQFLLQLLPLENFSQEWVHLYYLKDEPSSIVKLIEEHGKSEMWLSKINQKSWDNQDAWTAYRVAEAYRKFQDYPRALQFASLAVRLAPNHPEFLLKQSSLYALQGNFSEAEKGYKNVLRQNSLSSEAWSNLGYAQLAQNRTIEAENSLIKALRLDPDYMLAKVNLASVYLATERFAEARLLLENVLASDPTNKRVGAALDYLNSENL